SESGHKGKENDGKDTSVFSRATETESQTDLVLKSLAERYRRRASETTSERSTTSGNHHTTKCPFVFAWEVGGQRWNAQRMSAPEEYQFDTFIGTVSASDSLERDDGDSSIVRHPDDEEGDVIQGVVFDDGEEDGGFKLSRRTSRILSSYQEYIHDIEAEAIKSGLEQEVGDSRARSADYRDYRGGEEHYGLLNSDFYSFRDFSHLHSGDEEYATSNLHDLTSLNVTGLGPRNLRCHFWRSKRFRVLVLSALIGLIVLALGLNASSKKRLDDNAIITHIGLGQSTDKSTSANLDEVSTKYSEGRPLNTLHGQKENDNEFTNMLALYRPRLFDRRQWDGTTYDDALSFCSSRRDGMIICPFEVACPLSIDAIRAGTIHLDAEQEFVPIWSESKRGEWIGIGSTDSCDKIHGELPPEFGGQDVNARVMCCSPHQYGLPKVVDEQADSEPPVFGGDDHQNEATALAGGNELNDIDGQPDVTVHSQAKIEKLEPTLAAKATVEPTVAPTKHHQADISEVVEDGEDAVPADYLSPSTKPSSELATSPQVNEEENERTGSLNLKWFDRNGGYEGRTYNAARAMCRSMGRDLCPFDAVCPKGLNTAPIGGFNDGPVRSWVPVLDSYNDWVSLSSERPCHTWMSVNLEEPSWGTDGTNWEDTGNVACCYSIENENAAELSNSSVALTTVVTNPGVITEVEPATSITLSTVATASVESITTQANDEEIEKPADGEEGDKLSNTHLLSPFPLAIKEEAASDTHLLPPISLVTAGKEEEASDTHFLPPISLVTAGETTPSLAAEERGVEADMQTESALVSTVLSANIDGINPLLGRRRKRRGGRHADRNSPRFDCLSAQV
ncbi:hypothetical protein THAOC_04820, partial [Thalassiosira oceanica]